jgi:hypothetical protein
MISLQRFTHRVALCAVLGSALVTRDDHRPAPAPAPALDLLEPDLRSPARHRGGATMLAGPRRSHPTPRHIVSL